MSKQEMGAGAGALGLVVLTSMVVAAAFALGAYAVGLHQATALRAAGFVHWAGSAVPADIGVDTLNSPASSIWYRFEPGSRLDFAFIYAPELRAGIAGGAILCAGLLLTALSFGWHAWPARLRPVAVVLVWGGLALGVVPLLQRQPPSSFGVDWHAARLTDAVLQPGDLVALGNVSGFGDSYQAGRFLGGHSVIFASLTDGSQFILTELNGQDEAAPLVLMLQNFVAAKGTAL